MKRFDPAAIAREATPAAPGRPTMTIAHDVDDGRLVIFRLDPGQKVATHTSQSSVILHVVSGRGFVTGGEREEEAHAGEMFAFAPAEPHGMRAGEEPFVVAAIITPRPRNR
jgi:quercetin dioxygenase-like cupin family protein